MKRYPLKEIKSLINEIAKEHIIECYMNKDFNYNQLLILKYLFEHEKEEVHQKDFERILNVRKSTVSGILDTMEKNKIINRVSSSIDTRGKIVKLSSSSKKHKNEFLKSLDKIEDKLTEGIEKEKLDTFFEVIAKMKNNIKKEGTKNV